MKHTRGMAIVNASTANDTTFFLYWCGIYQIWVIVCIWEVFRLLFSLLMFVSLNTKLYLNIPPLLNYFYIIYIILYKYIKAKDEYLLLNKN